MPRRVARARRGTGADPGSRTTRSPTWEQQRGDYKSTPDEIADDDRHTDQGYCATLSRDRAGSMPSFQSWGLYRYFFDVFSMMLIGMALFRLGVLTLERPARLYVAMLLGGYAVGLTVNISGDALDHRPSVQRARLRRGRHQLRSRPAGDDDRPSRRRCCCSSARARWAGSGAPSPRSARWRSPTISPIRSSADLLHRLRLLRPARALPALLCRVRDLGGAAGLQPALAQAISASARSNGCGAASPI